MSEKKAMYQNPGYFRGYFKIEITELNLCHDLTCMGLDEGILLIEFMDGMDDHIQKVSCNNASPWNFIETLKILFEKRYCELYFQHQLFANHIELSILSRDRIHICFRPYSIPLPFSFSDEAAPDILISKLNSIIESLHKDGMVDVQSKERGKRLMELGLRNSFSPTLKGSIEFIPNLFNIYITCEDYINEIEKLGNDYLTRIEKMDLDQHGIQVLKKSKKEFNDIIYSVKQLVEGIPNGPCSAPR